MAGTVRHPRDATILRNPVGGPLALILQAADTGGVLTALVTTAAPGEGPPLHVHASEDELLYVLDGTFRFRIEDDVAEAASGAVAFVPHGVRHTWQNVGSTPARMFVIFTPSGMERFFERFSEHAEGDSAGEAFRRIGSDVGMEVVGPPLAQSHPAELP